LIFQQKFSQVFISQNFKDQVLCFIIVSHLFFNLVKHVQFKWLLKMIDESRLTHVLIWHDVKNQLMKLFKNTHIKLLSKLSASNKISLAMNCWTSITCHAFLTTTEYFINDVWNYHEILVDFDSFSNSHEEWNLINMSNNKLSSSCNVTC